MSLTRWLAIGSIAAALIAALVFGLMRNGESGAVSPVAVSAAGDANVQDGSSLAASSDDASQDGSVGSAAADEPDTPPASDASADATPAVPDEDGAGSTGDLTATPTPAATPNPTQQQTVSAGVRLRIPVLAVDAPVTPLGFNGAGGYAVPTTAYDVGWYEFSAWPGAAGNAVLGGHLNWRGSRGVFDRLDELSPGDMIYVDTSAGEVAYRVVGSHYVTAHTPFIEILGERSGPSTLTLFTCGGTFSTVAGEYDQRLVVNAVRA